MLLTLQDSWTSLPVLGTLGQGEFSDSGFIFKLSIGSLSKTFQLKYAHDVMSQKR